MPSKRCFLNETKPLLRKPMSPQFEASTIEISNPDSSINFSVERVPLVNELFLRQKWGVVSILLGAAVKVPTNTL